jgi:hypothetical protein
MAHEVLGERFYAARNLPAWHGRGTTDNVERSAIDALSVIGGSYKVTLAPLVTRSPLKSTGAQFDVQQNAILRQPLPEDPQIRVFGVVSPDYVLIDPQTFAILLDEHVARPVDTFMALRDGKLMVATFKLDSFSVLGDQTDNYLAVGNWASGSDANTALLTSVRVVCMNTWRMAERNATESKRFVHDSTLKHRMAAWLGGVVDRASRKLEASRTVAEALATFRLANRQQFDSVLSAAYPKPQLPDVSDLPKPVQEERLGRYEIATRVVDERRATAEELFRGAGIGMRSKATFGTLWGAYQAVCEVEDYRKGAQGDGLASAVLFGERGATKDRALAACQTLVRAGA